MSLPANALLDFDVGGCRQIGLPLPPFERIHPDRPDKVQYMTCHQSGGAGADPAPGAR